jgi:predicted ATPase
VEAIAHFNKGLEVLQLLPETIERAQKELMLQVALGAPLIATKGQAAPDVERAYIRAQELCQQIGDAPQLFSVLRGLMLYYNARGQFQTSYQFGEQLFRLAQSQHNPALLMLAHYQLGNALFLRGEPSSAYTHHMQALALYTPQEHRTLVLRYGSNLNIVSHSYAAVEIWQLGFPDQAMQHSLEARTLAREVSHPYSLALALLFATFLHQFRREAAAAHEQAKTLTTFAMEQGFAQALAQGTVLYGWALVMQGQDKAGMSQLRQGLAADLATGAKVFQPYFLGSLAEAYGEGGHPEEGLNALTEAEVVIGNLEMGFYEAELHRLKGQLLLQQSADNAAEAESCFHQSITIAQNQSAKSWELRAATSLARLWQSQGKRDEAHELLEPVYGWFTEGFDTADLIDAKALLDELSEGMS